MPTAAREIFRDDQPLFTGTHSGADSASTLRSQGAMFRSLGVDPNLSLYVENVTQSTGGALTAATDDEITATGVTWDYGDTYKVYATSTKNSYIGEQWTDVSRGWKAERGKLDDEGWRLEDVDIDDHGRKRVFGHGQPE